MGFFKRARAKNRPNYKVFVFGENFIIMLDGVPTAVGFYVTRCVTAGSPGEAGELAKEAVLGDPQLKEVLNETSNPPRLVAEEIEAMAPGDPEPETGYAFFVEDDPSN